MQKQVEVVLSSPLSYSKGGEKSEEQILVLHAPSISVDVNVRKAARKLRALGGVAFQQLAALAKGSERPALSEEKEKSEDSGEDLWQAFVFAGIDTEEMCGAMKALAPFVIKIGGSHAFKPAHWDALDMDDQDKIVGVYLQSFLFTLNASTPTV